MRETWNLYKQGWNAIFQKGRRILWIYGSSLTLLSFLDAAALYLLSKSIPLWDSSSIAIDEVGKNLGLVIILFLARSIFATGISYWGVRHFADQEVALGADSFSKINRLSWDHRQSVSAVDLYGSVDRGPAALLQGVVLNVVTIITELLSALVILGVILVMQPLTAIVAFVYFISIAFIQHRLLSVASHSAGAQVNLATVSTYQMLTDANAVAKLLAISPSSSLEHSLNQTRSELAHARARSSFLALLPRYFMESVLAIGFLVVAGSAYLVGGVEAAVAALTVFAAAGFRLLPIINRIQGLTLQIFSHHATARLAFPPEHNQPTQDKFSNDSECGVRRLDETVIALKNISYQYPGSTNLAINQVSLVLSSGLQYAIVGPSGAGKTTLIDICLGLLTPQSGSVIRSTNSLNVSYVPQENKLVSGSLSANVALEWEDSAISEAGVKQALIDAQIESLILEELADGALLGDGAISLSGGQKQRIGLARALYRRPDFLVLDEATSALDSEMEHSVIGSINKLRGKATVLIVAHRLSTVKHVDQVIYMANGSIQGIGTFNELRKSIPEFAEQIRLGSLDLNY